MKGKRRVTRFNDADYLDRLTPEEREYYQRFVAEYYFGRRPADRREAFHDPQQMRELWNSQYAERNDCLSTNFLTDSGQRDRLYTEASDPEHLLILYDLREELLSVSIAVKGGAVAQPEVAAESCTAESSSLVQAGEDPRG